MTCCKIAHKGRCRAWCGFPIRDDDPCLTPAIAVSCCIVFLLGIVFIGITVITIPDSEYCFDENPQWGTMSSTPLEEGLTTRQPAATLYCFKTQLSTFEETLDVQTADLVDLRATVSIQFVTNRTRAFRIVHDVGGEEQHFKNVAFIFDAVTRDVCAKYNATQFISRRSEIEQDIDRTMSSVFESTDALGIIIRLVTLANIAIPDDMLDQAKMQQDAIQALDLAQATRGSTIRQALSDLEKAEEEARLQEIEAVTAAAAQIVAATATRDAIVFDLVQIATVLAQNALDTGFTPAEYVTEFEEPGQLPLETQLCLEVAGSNPLPCLLDREVRSVIIQT